MDIEKTIEFIIAQQAQFSSNMIVLQEHMVALQENMVVLEQKLSHLTDDVRTTEAQIQAIAKATHLLLDTRELDRQTHERDMQAMNARHEELTDKLDAMIRIVDDLIHRRDDPQQPR